MRDDTRRTNCDIKQGEAGRKWRKRRRRERRRRRRLKGGTLFCRRVAAALRAG